LDLNLKDEENGFRLYYFLGMALFLMFFVGIGIGKFMVTLFIMVMPQLAPLELILMESLVILKFIIM